MTTASVEEIGSARRWYVLLVLTLVYTLSIADRFVMSTLTEPIKASLKLSDSGIAILGGTGLALFYVTAGLPLAYLADRTNRRAMVALAVGAWSLMTACCGLVQNFWQMLFARMGVGVGEAGGTPPSTSLLSDYFPWRRRALAMSVYSLGASLGSMVGSSAGYANDAWGWRSAFFVLGIPGLIVAVIVWFTIREPVRGRLDEAPPIAQAGFDETLEFIYSHPALLHALLGAAVYTLWAWGLMWWTPSFLVRSHHMTLGAAGGALSMMYGIGGSAVLLLTMVVSGLLANRDARAVPWLVAGAILIATVPSIVAYYSESKAVSIAMLWVFIPLSYAPFGPTFALLQNLAPASMRAQVVAMMLFCANIANLVIAPQAVGFASDLMTPSYGAEALRHALIPLAFVGFWAAWHYWRCAQTLTEGLRGGGNVVTSQDAHA